MDIRAMQLAIASLVWVTRPDRIRVLPLEEQERWLRETLKKLMTAREG